jgi:Flp pilus assembly pilin Flp
VNRSKPKKVSFGFLRRVTRSRKGQGIAEYGAMIAFVAVIIALFFGLQNGTLQPAISKAFSSVSSQLNNLSDSASGASS